MTIASSLIALITGISFAGLAMPALPEGVNVEVASIETPDPENPKTYRSLYRIKGSYVLWQASAYGTEELNYKVLPYQQFIEILLIIRNEAKDVFTIEGDNIVLKLDSQEIKFWEAVTPGWAKYPELREKPSFDEKSESYSILHLYSKGTECKLKPGEQTFIVFLFLVPSKWKEARLIVTPGHEVKIEVPGQSKQTPKLSLVQQLQKAYISDALHPELKGTNVEELCTKLKESVAATKDPEKRANILFALATVVSYQDSGVSKQQDYLLKGLEDARAVGYQKVEAAIRGKLAMVYECQGEIESARKEMQSALEIHKKLNLRREIATDLCNLGMIEGNNGKTKEAIQNLVEALRISKEIKSDLIVACALCNLSAAYVDADEQDKGKRMYDELQQYRQFIIPFFLYYREQKFSSRMPPLPPFLAGVEGGGSIKAVKGKRQYYNFDILSYRTKKEVPVIPCGFIEAPYILE